MIFLQSFSKASLGDLDGIGSCHKRTSVERILSTDSIDLSTPPPLKRLQAFREKLLTYPDDWKYDTKCSNETKCPTPKMPSPKLPSPKHPSPMCSPNLHSQRQHHFHPVHYPHDFIYPHEHFHHHHLSHYTEIDHFDSIHGDSPCRSTERMRSQTKHVATPVKHKPEIKSPSGDIKSSKSKKKMRRAKSCPKDLFSISSKCSDNDKSQNESIETNERRLCRDDLSPCYIEDFQTPPLSRQQNTHPRPIPKIRIHKPKSKTPNSMDEYVASKLVRSNHAAKLRQKSSHQKINELAEEKLKATMHVSKFIPKCHHWNVRETPAWKTFLSEE